MVDDQLSGVLVVDKPRGPTSHDVVARVRRALRTKRIGHTGTLDPMATGVLALVIGRATRLASFLSSAEKTYEADVRLGLATETYDAAERQAADLPPPPAPDITLAEVEAALDGFRGTFMQAPPPYSAKKIGGVPAHRLARRNMPAQPAPVRVTVSELQVRSLAAGVARLVVTASAGFYVRSLAHDLGTVLGCGAHLEALQRTRSGAFALNQAVGLAAIETDADAVRLIPLEGLLLDLPAVTLQERGAERAGHGRELGPDDITESGRTALLVASPDGPVRMLDPQGHLLGLARIGDGGALRPAVVLV